MTGNGRQGVPREGPWSAVLQKPRPFSDGQIAGDVSRVSGMKHNLVDPETITTEMAVQIRTWRVREGFSWRAVAQAASELWGSEYGSNQLYGEDLCVAAARVLGENPHQEPWN